LTEVISNHALSFCSQSVGVETVAERFEFQDENIYFRYGVTLRCVALVLYGESLKSDMDICTSASPWLD